MMREYARWDALVAELSSDEESEVEDECADIAAKMEDAMVSEEGAAQGEKNGGVRVARGRGIGESVMPSYGNGSAERVGEAKDAAAGKEMDATQPREVNGGAAVEIELSLPESSGDLRREKVSCSFTPRAVRIHVAVEGNDDDDGFVFQRSQLPVELLLEKCAFRIASRFETSASGDRIKRSHVVLTLAKAPVGTNEDGTAVFEPWTCGLGKRSGDGTSTTADRPRPLKRAIHDYSWLDRKRSVKVWLRVPGVRALPESCLRVSFRVKSFDVSVDDDQSHATTSVPRQHILHTFAVTELPMEIVPAESSVRIADNEDVVEVLLKKEVQTTWFKLQVHH